MTGCVITREMIDETEDDKEPLHDLLGSLFGSFRWGLLGGGSRFGRLGRLGLGRLGFGSLRFRRSLGFGRSLGLLRRRFLLGGGLRIQYGNKSAGE